MIHLELDNMLPLMFDLVYHFLQGKVEIFSTFYETIKLNLLTRSGKNQLYVVDLISTLQPANGLKLTTTENKLDREKRNCCTTSTSRHGAKPFFKFEINILAL